MLWTTLSTLHNWAAEFKRGRESLEDDPRSRRIVPLSDPLELHVVFQDILFHYLLTQENIDSFHHLVMDDRHLTVNQIANALG